MPLVFCHLIVYPPDVKGFLVFRWLNSYKPITNTTWVRARLCKLQKSALDSQPQVIKFTSCLPMIGGSLRVLRLLPSPLKLVAMI